MIISLQDSNGKSISKEIDFAYHNENLEYNNEPIRLLSPISVKGHVILEKGVADLRLAVHTDILMACSRCLDDFSYPVHMDIQDLLSRRELEDMDYELIEDGVEIDLKELVESHLYLSLPMKVLCKEDCKGLCQECGANRNHGQCSCGHEEIDPRFSALRDMFKEV